MTLLPTGRREQRILVGHGVQRLGDGGRPGGRGRGQRRDVDQQRGDNTHPADRRRTGSTVEAECITDTGLIGGEDDGVGDAFVYNTNNSTVYDCGPDTSSVFGI